MNLCVKIRSIYPNNAIKDLMEGDIKTKLTLKTMMEKGDKALDKAFDSTSQKNGVKKRPFFLLLASFLIFIQLYGQKTTVEGSISSDGEPLAYCTIFLDGTGWGTISDSTGIFKIEDVDSGRYVLRVSCSGYENFKRDIILKGSEFLKLNLEVKATASRKDEVVVTGTMKAVSKSASPIPVEVYSQAYFKKNPTPNLFESLQIVNGVQPQLNCNVCNTGDIHINGMEGPYTMVTIDGMPIVSSLSTVYGLSGIPNSIVQRIEVVKGPASTLYGSEAVGGLINVITKDPENAPRFSADIFGTSHGEINTDVSYKQKMGKATSMFSLNYFNFNQRRDVNEDNFTDITLQNRISIFNKWSFQRKKQRVASIAARYLYEDRWGGELQWSDKFRGGDNVYGESIYTKRYEVIGIYQLPLNREKVIFQYSFNSHHQNSAYGKVPYIASQDVAFAQLYLDKRLGKHQQILAGLPLRYTYYDDNTWGTRADDTVHFYNKPQKIFLAGAFLQDEITFTSRLTSLAGIRYDYNSVHGSILSPRLSFKYATNANNILRLSGGNGYRVVNLFTEDHAALTGARQVTIQSALKPEQSWNANINYQRFLDFRSGFGSVDASIFYTYFTNKIVGDFLTDPDKIIYNNLNGYAISRGVTLNTEYSFAFPLKIILGGTFMQVFSKQKNASGYMVKVPQLHAPAFSGTFAISYKVEKLKLTIDYTGRVTGPMALPVVPGDFRPGQSPWFSIQNIQFTKSLKRGWQIYAGIKNLLNFIPKDPILRPFDPFDKYIHVNNPKGYTFDTSYNYASIQGIRGFAGIRWTVR